VSVSLLLFFTISIIHSTSVRAQQLGPANIKAETGRPSASNPDPAQGVSAEYLVRRALSSNAELAAARLGIERARARLTQAGLRPNPTLDFEQQQGVQNTPGERVTTVGVSVPFEIGGKRGRRLDLAQAELEVAQAEVAERERRLAAEVHAAHVETLTAQRELEITEGLNQLDAQTVRVVEARVSEGDAAPLEVNLLRVELDRLRSRRALVEGKLQAALLKLKTLAGIPPEDPLKNARDGRGGKRVGRAGSRDSTDR
jgi:cobalt-zinc-cadmium efflux system outer membrane protein